MYRVVRKRTVGVQAGPSFKEKDDKSVGVDRDTSSTYAREKRTSFLTYDTLKQEFLWSKELTVSWLMDIGLIANERHCAICKKDMTLTSCQDRKDGYRWECRRSIGGKKHRREVNIHKGSWFQGANLSIIEVLKFTYWWCVGLNQVQTRDITIR